MQLGEFLKINKRTVQNKRASETSCKNNHMCKCGIQLSVVLKELERILVDTEN